jgi:hypothetical protein
VVESISSDPIGELERIAQSDVGRNIGALAHAARGGLNAAVADLASRDELRIAILTGAYVDLGDARAAETDGPAGAAMLAAGLRAIGADVRLVTDPLCAPVVRCVAAAVGVPIDIAWTPAEVRDLQRELASNGTTHVITIERLGPAADGEVYNMRGEPMTVYTAPLHTLMLDGDWETIAIGDGGNELGMGSLPHELVAAHVEHGERIHCEVPADHLIVSGVSNWGAIALLLALGLHNPPSLRALVTHASADEHERLVRLSVGEGGAVDGTTGLPTSTVDGLPMTSHGAVINDLVTLATYSAATRAG